METPKYSLLAEHNQGRAQSPETPHDVEGKNWSQVEEHHSRLALSKNTGVEKEKSQRHDHAEEEKHFVAQGKLHAHAREGNEICQSRSLLPVSSMNTSSSDGVAISRDDSSLPAASRCLTSATMTGAVRGQCST